MKVLIPILKCLPFAALLFTALASAAESVPAPVNQIKTVRDGDTFTTELVTVNPWNPSEAKIQFVQDAVQIDFPQAFLDKGKQLIKVEDRVFKSIYATQADASTVRAKLTVNDGLSATSLLGLVSLRKTATGISIVVNGDAGNATGKEAKSEVMSIAVASEEQQDDTLSTKLVAGAPAPTEAGTETAAVTAAATAPQAKLSEAEIPVLTKAKIEKKDAGGGLGRLLATLGVLTIVLGAAAFGVRRYTQKVGTKSVHTAIKVITQHHLGPKRSLAIVQVAGESILIGITDQNISMIKSLSLIDDEVPAELPARFDHSLEDFEEPAKIAAPARRGLLGRSAPKQEVADNNDDAMDDFAMRGLNEIQDVVSTRLKNMRNF
jgi:flagellar protein FliO/FliZ